MNVVIYFIISSFYIACIPANFIVSMQVTHVGNCSNYVNDRYFLILYLYVCLQGEVIVLIAVSRAVSFQT